MLKVIIFLFLSLVISINSYAKGLEGSYIHEDSGKDYDAKAIITNHNDNLFLIEINASEYSRFSTCQFEGKCSKINETTFKCLSGDENNPEEFVKLTLLENNTFKIEDLYPHGLNCGIACYLDGNYKLKNEETKSENKTGTENLEALCPERKLEQGTLRGIYEGNECGDNCWSNFKFADNKNYSFLCGDENAEKYFGKKKGAHVEIEYETIQSFFDLTGGENPECIRIEICKNGKIIDDQIPLSTKVDNIVCKEKILDTGSVAGLLTQIEKSEEEPKVCALFINLKSKEDYIINIPCSDTPKYESYLGKDVKLNYSVLQHFSNSEPPSCIREDLVKSIQVLE